MTVSHPRGLPLGSPQRSQQLVSYRGRLQDEFALRPACPDGSSDFAATSVPEHPIHFQSSPVSCSPKVVTSVRTSRTESFSIAGWLGSWIVVGPVGASPTETPAIQAHGESGYISNQF